MIHANPAIALSIELHPRTYDLPIYDRKWLAFFPGLRPESLAAVVRLAALCEKPLRRRLAGPARGGRGHSLGQTATSTGWPARWAICGRSCRPSRGNLNATEPRPSLTTEAGGRIVSLDQFRGYTVAGMLLVNFLSGYQAVPAVLSAPQHVLQLRRHDHAAVLLRGRLRLSPDVLAPAGQPAATRPAVAAVLRRNVGLVPDRLRPLPSGRQRRDVGRAPEAGTSRLLGPGLSARAVSDAGPHRDHVGLDLARDRGRRAGPGRSS